MILEIPINDNEDLDSYYRRVYDEKFKNNLTWGDVANICNKYTNQNLTPDAYRKKFRSFRDDPINPTIQKIIELEYAKNQLSDERVQVNALFRRMSREQTILDIANDVAKNIGTRVLLDSPKELVINPDSNKGVLCISDWHYGIEIENHFNKYNPNICKTRINNLKNITINRCKQNNVEELFIVNLGDLISGRIHTTIRINNRIDVITQVIEVSELLAEFINDLSSEFKINYVETMDNHSRIEPLKENSLELESLCRITHWFLKERLKDNKNVNFIDNEYADDIATFKIFDFQIGGVHGDKDKKSKVLSNISLLTKLGYDVILTAHLHHLSVEEQNNALIVSNGSVMGTDNYALDLRLNSRPSQNLIIMTKNNPCDTLYPIVLE